MTKKHIVQITQIVLIALLVCVKLFVFPQIEAHISRTFDPAPRIYAGTVFWFLMGLALAMPKWFTGRKFKLNLIYLTIELAAIGYIALFWIWRFGGIVMFRIRIEELFLFSLIAGYFLADCFKSHNLTFAEKADGD
ncbi:MAG: hypothetical protein FWE06_04310 [Oscillospiraceae bacterium]|nr:hypothetical protein [Oscillospiraceae bacterium]